MKKIVWKVLIPMLAVLVLLIVVVAIKTRKTVPIKISAFGQYKGYSEVLYDGWQRRSTYLMLSDGTRLAYDLFLPTKKGVPANQPLPVLFKYTPYDRAWTLWGKDGHDYFCVLASVWYCDPMMRARAFIMNLKSPSGSGQIKDALNRTEWLVEMVKSGYAVIVVDRPGTGASFGKFNGDPEVAASEVNEILNWIAAQPWSDGNIGMFGDSIQAQIQFRAATTGNPHLKAILPATTWMDNYSAVMFPGGIPGEAFANFYTKVNKAFDAMATPVDQDKDGTLLLQARAERQNTSALATGAASYENYPFRDSLYSDGKNFWVYFQTLYPLLEKINHASVPVYLINGWYDIYARDNFLIYDNLSGPKKLLVRPTDHAGIEAPSSDVDYGAEAHRWFDYWLKGINNGIMDDPPVHYYLQGSGKGQEWQSAYEWPLKDQTMIHYYLDTGDTSGKVSINNGLLDPFSPKNPQASDSYTVDYSTTTGPSPLWTGVATSHKYPNMRTHDGKSLTYTSPTLTEALNIAGHPIVHLWLSTYAPDLDVFVYLEQVDGKGNSTYITEGELRSSLRLLSAAPFNNFGLPWHDYFQSELQPIPAGQPVEVVFDLRPTAWKFPPDSHMRITVAFADAGNFDTPVLDPAPTLQILRDSGHPSYVELPVAANP